MEIPSRYPPPRDFGTLPSISHDDGFRGPFGGYSRNDGIEIGLSPAIASHPMSIQGASSSHNAPPPLPPPRLAPVIGPIDPNLEHFRESPMRRDFEGSPSSDPFGHSHRRPQAFSREIDEGYQSIETARSPIDPRPSSSFGLKSMQNFKPESAITIDRSMVNKLDGRRRPDDRLPGLSSSASDVPTSRAFPPQPPQLSLPHRSKLYETNGFTKSPIPVSAGSPLASPFSHAITNSSDHRSPLGTEVSEMERSPHHRSRRTNSGSVPDDETVSTQGSREDEGEFPSESDVPMRGLHLDDRREWERQEYYQTIGLKRRASSPPPDDLPLGSDAVRRREGGAHTRGSPTPRLQVPPNGSMSSCSSGRSGSYMSSLSNPTPSSMTSMMSMNSFGRRSPNALSPAGLSPTETVGSPFGTPMSITTSPRSSISRAVAAQPPQSRTLSEHNRALASPRKYAEIPKSAAGSMASKMKDPYMCQCCPKKPKKFDTEEELNAHSAEKQYECSFCGSRFKNKNEAERHQNSLHVRRHSWSCSALTGYERAFHDSPSRPGEADTCGYCGEEFNRNGAPGAPGQSGRYCSDQDWEERIRHLQDVHKFRECNASKKFYRADHFRQHLKHSHAGTSGKWTNMLENACMIEEEPPVGAR